VVYAMLIEGAPQQVVQQSKDNGISRHSSQRTSALCCSSYVLCTRDIRQHSACVGLHW
jgi:hypothetical protein